MITVYAGESSVSFVKELSKIPSNAKILHLDSDNLNKLNEFIQSSKAGDEIGQLFVCNPDPEKMFSQFASGLKLIEAAGGLVRNAEEKILMIFRNEKWDLPKGKIESPESIEMAAVREVQEECGVVIEKIIRTLSSTYHIYDLGKNSILKKTYWFEMYCKDTRTPVPQKEEGITAASWMTHAHIKVVLKNTYVSVQQVIRESGLFL